VKLSLILIGEIFTEIISYTKLHDWIDFLIPIIIKKNVLDKNFIQEEAKNVLNNFSKNIHCTEGLLIFLKIIQDRNLKYSSKAYEFFLDLTEEISADKLKNKNNKTGIKWEFIFRELIEIAKIKKDPYPKRSKNIFSIFLKKLGIEFMEKLINDMLNLEDYLHFSKTDMISFSEISRKIIQNEKGNQNQNGTGNFESKSKEIITLKDHIKSLKNSEKIDKEEIEANNTNIYNEVEIMIFEPKNFKENTEKYYSSTKAKIPELVLTSSKKSEEFIKEIEQNEIKSNKKEIILEENPLKNDSIIFVKSANKAKTVTKINEKENDKNINEERPKNSIEVDLIKSSNIKNKDQENIIN